MKSVKGREVEGRAGERRIMIPSGGKRDLLGASGICGGPGLAGSAMKAFP